MPSSSIINFSAIPAPEVIEQISYEEILAAMLADLISRDSSFTALVESDPAYKILEVAAYREVLIRQRTNEAALQTMLAYATGANLDQIAARYEVTRSGTPATVQIGTGTSGIIFTASNGGGAGNGISITFLPPTPSAVAGVTINGLQIAVTLATDSGSVITSTAAQIVTLINDSLAANLVVASLVGDGSGLVAPAAISFLTGGVDETDTALRSRIQISLQGFSCAGPKGAYRFFALSVAGVADISVQGPEDDGAISPGQVMICAMGSAGDGTIADPNVATAGESGESPILAAIRTAVNADNVRPLNDTVIVRAAAKVTYSISASIYTYPGPDPTAVMAAAQAAITAWVAAQQKIGQSIPLSGIIANLYQPGVQNVVVSSPVADVAITKYQFPYCTGISLTFAGTHT